MKNTMDQEQIRNMKVDPGASHVIGVDQNGTAVLVPRDTPRVGGVGGDGGGIVHREISRLEKEIARKLQLAKCCPPVLLEPPIAFAADSQGPQQGTVLAYNVELGATLQVFQTAGTTTPLVINTFDVDANADGSQDVELSLSIGITQDGQQYALMLTNPCGCSVFVGTVFFGTPP